MHNPFPTPLDRRGFLCALLASAAAVGLPLVRQVERQRGPWYYAWVDYGTSYGDWLVRYPSEIPQRNGRDPDWIISFEPYHGVVR